jgi:dihydrofolate reductase
MSQLVYLSITSLDGFVADERGRFDWSMPDEEVHAFINDLERPIRTHFYGRRLYEVMTAWEDLDLTGEPDVMSDFAELWRGADKIVYSRTLTSVPTARTRIENQFSPDAIRALKASAGSDISIGGAELAGQALAAGLVDELHQFLSPVVVGGGKHFLPRGVSLALELLDERRFGNGVVYLHHRVVNSAAR